MKTPTADVAASPMRDALEHGGGARLELEVLQEQHDLEAFAVDAREPEQQKPEDLPVMNPVLSISRERPLSLCVAAARSTRVQ